MPICSDSMDVLSIIVVNWNTRDLLRGCLKAIEDGGVLIAGSSSSIETIVVDNASTDGSAVMLRREFPSVSLIENQRNAGFAAGNNLGIRAAKGGYLLLLNSDTAVCPGVLEALVEFMDAHPRAGACGARLLNADRSLQPSAHPMLTPGREFWRLMFLERIHRRATYPLERWVSDGPRRVDVIKGACLMLRRKALDQVGPLDESYFMYTEEVDLCYRLAQAGWELWWVPQASVIHYGEASSSQAREEMYVQLYRSKVQFYRKFGGERRAYEFKRLLRIAYTLRWLATAARGLTNAGTAARARFYRSFLSAISEM